MKSAVKGFVLGAVVATVGVSGVFAAASIKSAGFNQNSVIFNGQKLDMGTQAMISVVLDGETDASNYMPVRGVLTAMGFDVKWDGAQKAVIVSSIGAEQSVVTSKEGGVVETKNNVADFLGGWIFENEEMTAKIHFTSEGEFAEMTIMKSSGETTVIVGNYKIEGNKLIQSEMMVVSDDGNIDKAGDGKPVESYIKMSDDKQTFAWEAVTATKQNNPKLTYKKDVDGGMWYREALDALK